MDSDFWHARWREGQIGFHLPSVNPQLVRHHDALGASGGSRVLVPLCGKSLDLLWLAQQGHEVVGVELSPVAVQAFFAENNLVASTDQLGPFTRYHTDKIEILCGDIFALDRSLLGKVDAVFDRAALVAFPESMRPKYLQLMAAVVPVGALGLLIAFEYQPVSVSGPPFSVDDTAVHALYDDHFAVTLLERVDILDSEPRFKQRGMTALHESAYALVKKPDSSSE